MGFEKVFNHKPQVKESANARVNLIGEHTDYTGGYVMPTLLGFKNTIEMSKNNDQNFVVFSEAPPQYDIHLLFLLFLPSSSILHQRKIVD